MAERIARHWKTEGNVYSICEATGTNDVFSYGTDTGPTDYCTACREAEPEWIHLEDEEYFKLIQHIF